MTASLASLLPADACRDAREWLASLPADTTPQQAWNLCPRGDWLLWLASRREVDRKLLVLAACACARLVLHLVPAGEDRPRVAIESAERWTRGEATVEEVRSAAAAAAAAADAADADAAAYAAAAAAYAAYAADAAAYAAAAAADADAAAAAAAYAAAAGTARIAMHQRTADAVRAIILEVP